MSKTKSGFTIVELLIVIVVIGILAAITIVAYNGFQTRARDTIRMSDIKSIQKLVELYYAENGVYPPSSNGANWAGLCSSFGSTENYVPSLLTYTSKLPLDPRWKTADNKCYLYISNGIDYMLLAWGAMEGICGGDPGNSCNSPEIRAMDRQNYIELSIAVYSPGARLW